MSSDFRRHRSSGVFGFKEAPFRSRRKVFCVCGQSPVFSQSRGGRKVSPSISSGTAPIIAVSNSPLPGEAGCLLKRSASAFRHPHRLPAQRTIKLLRLLAVLQPSFHHFSRLIVKDRGLLKPRMKITAYNQHDVGSFVEPWPFRNCQLTLRSSQRRYAIKRGFCFAKRSKTAVEGSLARRQRPRRVGEFSLGPRLPRPALVASFCDRAGKVKVKFPAWSLQKCAETRGR